MYNGQEYTSLSVSGERRIVRPEKKRYVTDKEFIHIHIIHTHSAYKAFKSNCLIFKPYGHNNNSRQKHWPVFHGWCQLGKFDNPRDDDFYYN